MKLVATNKEKLTELTMRLSLQRGFRVKYLSLPSTMFFSGNTLGLVAASLVYCWNISCDHWFIDVVFHRYPMVVRRQYSPDAPFRDCL